MFDEERKKIEAVTMSSFRYPTSFTQDGVVFHVTQTTRDWGYALRFRVHTIDTGWITIDCNDGQWYQLLEEERGERNG